MNRRNDFRGRSGPPRRPSGERRPPRSEPSQHGAADRSATGYESTYLNSLMGTALPIVVVLRQGDQIAGQLVWYDRACLKLAPSDGSPSLLIPKANIKYLYEEASLEATA